MKTERSVLSSGVIGRPQVTDEVTRRDALAALPSNFCSTRSVRPSGSPWVFWKV
ncbi:hypothetical protein [Streptomyces afghaniensis]|uniref:hypothetical protein n=1 Tax=Streptomyces afghaniensis TaxID=66865 RepID=UPI0027D795F6|nr:hypothetical protein [Streptomyces afghaniensis]